MTTPSTNSPTRSVRYFATPQDVARDKRLSSTPIRYRKLFERAFAGKLAPRSAIKAQCYDCTCFNLDAVYDCPAPGCPLWEYRPQRKNDKCD